MDTLKSLNYFKVERQNFTIPKYSVINLSTLAQVSPNPTTFNYGSDFVDFQFSASGDVIANISVGKRFNDLTTKLRLLIFVFFNLVPNLGCDKSDWADFPAGNIALVLRGNCPFVEKTVSQFYLVDFWDLEKTNQFIT